MFSNWIKLRMELMQSNCNVILIIDLQGKSHPEEYYVNVICDPHVTVMNSCAEFNHSSYIILVRIITHQHHGVISCAGDYHAVGIHVIPCLSKPNKILALWSSSCVIMSLRVNALSGHLLSAMGRVTMTHRVSSSPSSRFGSGYRQIILIIIFVFVS